MEDQSFFLLWVERLLLKYQIIKDLMIDHQELEQLLHTTKLTSMADVIHFLLENVIKIINFEPIHDLTARITQLEKPQGLDSIMIEEVKTLAEAIIEQKEEQIRRDLEKSIAKNISIAFESESNNTRQSLREIDMNELFPKETNKKNNALCESKTTNSNCQSYSQSQLQQIRREINDIRYSMSKKVEKREISDFKIDVQKSLTNKMTIAQTEKVVEKFQREVFHKMTETANYMQKMELDLKKSLIHEASEIKKEFYESAKMQDLKQRIQKLEKKTKKVCNEAADTVRQTMLEIQVSKKQSKESLEQMCNLIENIENKLKINSSELKANASEIKSLGQQVARNSCLEICGASWMAEKGILKNGSICWEKQLTNEDDELFIFEEGKTQVIVTSPGFFRLECVVNGCEKQPQILINSQVVMKLFLQEGGRGSIYSRSQIFRLTESSNKIWVRAEKDGSFSSAFLMLTKIG